MQHPNPTKLHGKDVATPHPSWAAMPKTRFCYWRIASKHAKSKLHTAGDGQMYGCIYICAKRLRTICIRNKFCSFLFHSCPLSQGTHRKTKIETLRSFCPFILPLICSILSVPLSSCREVRSLLSAPTLRKLARLIHRQRGLSRTKGAILHVRFHVVKARAVSFQVVPANIKGCFG